MPAGPSAGGYGGSSPRASRVPPLPRGFCVELDPATRQLTDSILFGGAPARAMLLSDAGRGALAELRAGAVSSAASGHLARRLTDAGLAHPRPARASAAPDVTVLIPVRDRAALLDRCLQAAGGRYPVLVVDDGSADQPAIATVAARHGAAVVRRAESGGPAAARNTGLAAIGTELVAFLDSDCVPPADWIEKLAGHLMDPLVGAVAPRIVEPAEEVTVAGRCSVSRLGASRYGAARSSLDLGPGAARVVPMTRVSYVPTAALLVRRSALDSVAPGGSPFDPALRHGEDVDLVWRLHDAGWRIRYDPAVRVRHAGPCTWPGLLGRRFRYGTSAGPLARRHPERLAPLVLQPWPAVAVAALLARRPAVAAIATAGGCVTLGRAVRRAGLPATGVTVLDVTRAGLTSVRQTWLGTGRYATQFAAPALALALAAPSSRTRHSRWGRRAAVAALLLAPVLEAWRRAAPSLEADPYQPGSGRQARPGPLPFAVGHIADDIAYGAGVWAGCAAARTLTPVIPHVSWQPFRVTRERNTAHGQHVV
jgi:mycofactocin system glycosyltransferase